MTKRVVVGVATGTLLAAAALAQGPERLDKKTLRYAGEGRAVYLRHCTGCHGTDARGGPTGTNHVAAPDLTLIAVRDGSFNAFHVANHIDGRKNASEVAMPRWGSHFRGEYPTGDAYAAEGYVATRVYLLAHYLDFIQASESAPPVKQ